RGPGGLRRAGGGERQPGRLQRGGRGGGAVPPRQETRGRLLRLHHRPPEPQAAMNEYKLKEQICEIGRRAYNKGFGPAKGGHTSGRLNDREVMCTPTMISKGFMKPEDLCKVDYEGKQLAGTRKRSSEILLHLAVYKNRPDVSAVVHCHPPHATAFAVA